VEESFFIRWMIGFVGGFPQSFLVFYAGLGLVGVTPKSRNLIIPALILGAIIPVVRNIPLLHGWHILLFFGAYLVVARVFRLASLISILAADALSFILVALSDVLLVVPALQIFKLSHAEIWDVPVMRILFTWLEAGFLIAAAYLVKRKGFVLIPLSQGHSAEENREA